MPAYTPSPRDLAAVQAVVVAYANALDAHDWSGFEALFESQVEIDYRSLGTTHGVFPAREWADRCRVLSAFAATHHKVSNFTFAFEGEDRAEVRSYVDAAHFIEAEGRMLEACVLGVYSHGLVRRGEDWRIRKCALWVAGYPGGREKFEAVFGAARAAFTTQGSRS
jgi:3-phenylpropionate/cinnamic acid dioxygenase small subunit